MKKWRAGLAMEAHWGKEEREKDPAGRAGDTDGAGPWISGPRRSLKAQSLAGSRGRSAPRRAGLTEAALRLESGLPKGAKPTLGANKYLYSKIMKDPQSVWKTLGIGLPTRIV